MKQLKVGVIGLGNIAKEHLRAYQNNPRVEIAALCNTNAARLAAYAKEFHVAQTFTDLDEMLALPELDAVSICAINSQHAPYALRAIAAGKHVLVEKPMATTLAQAEQMRDAADAAGVLLMVGFVCRFGEDTEMLRDMVDAGVLGEIYYAKASYLRRHGCPGGWFQNRALSGGGPLIDLGVHRIDQVRYLAGSPRPISVYGATFSKLQNRPGLRDGISARVRAGSGSSDIFDVEDLASAMVRFDNGLVLQVEASFSLNLREDQENIELFGTRAGARLNPFEVYTELGGHMVSATAAQAPVITFARLFDREIDHFAACILDGAPCRASAEDGVIVTQIVDAIYRSAECGHEIVL